MTTITDAADLPTTTGPYAYLIDAAEARHGGLIDHFTCGYTTDGGTYVLASAPAANDDDRPRDLIAVLPAPIEGTRVVVLRPTVNPDLVKALRDHFDNGSENA